YWRVSTTIAARQSQKPPRLWLREWSPTLHPDRLPFGYWRCRRVKRESGLLVDRDASFGVDRQRQLQGCEDVASEEAKFLVAFAELTTKCGPPDLDRPRQNMQSIG